MDYNTRPSLIHNNQVRLPAIEDNVLCPRMQHQRTTNVKRADFIQNGTENHIYQSCQLVFLNDRLTERSNFKIDQYVSPNSSDAGSGNESRRVSKDKNPVLRRPEVNRRGAGPEVESTTTSKRRRSTFEDGPVKRSKPNDFNYPNSQSIICITDKVKIFDSEREMVRPGDILYVHHQEGGCYGIYIGNGYVTFKEASGVITQRELNQQNLCYPIATEQFDSVARLSWKEPRILSETAKRARYFIGRNFQGDGEMFVRYCRF